MVDWFNRADETYRTDLYRINDLNFARFEAKVEQRFAESGAILGRLRSTRSTCGRTAVNQFHGSVAVILP